jgi:hypothetical protein
MPLIQQYNRGLSSRKKLIHYLITADLGKFLTGMSQEITTYKSDQKILLLIILGMTVTGTFSLHFHDKI